MNFVNKKKLKIYSTNMTFLNKTFLLKLTE